METEKKQLAEVINSYLSMLKECGVSYDDFELIMDYCQSLNKVLMHNGLRLIIDDLVYQSTYYNELDVIFYIEHNDILNRMTYYCSLV
jgi:hypothetical protein